MIRRTIGIAGALLLVLAVAAPVMGQGVSGSITGIVTHDGQPLPGVAVTLSSPAMQGQRTVITGRGGSFSFPGLPPGEYLVKATLEGFQPMEIPVKVTVSQGKTLEIKMYPKTIEEEIVVTGSYETVSTDSQGSETMEQDLIEKLPVQRTPQSAVALSAGTASTGPGGNTTIMGAQSYENLYTLNGVVLNENIRGQPFDMFIEDAIQETTIITSGVSAEYGRFAGGVVNVVTKTGGNEFSGSLRLSLTNDKWSSPTPKTTEQIDKTNKVWEGTLGGYILKDHLWWFLAGRTRSISSTDEFYYEVDEGPYTRKDEEDRFELKLTGAITANHRLTFSYIDIARDQTNIPFFTPADWASIDPSRSLPLTGMAFNYTGVITDNFFIEAQYSERDFTFEGSGGDDRSLEGGTPVIDGTVGAVFNAPIFCGVCADEERNNTNWLAKASWFLSPEKGGSHDLVFGYDEFEDIRKADNWQSASGWLLWTRAPQDYSTGAPLMEIPTYGTWIIWGSVLEESKGTSFKTKSFYVNDTWRISNRITLNLGLRYDKNDGKDAGGAKVADDSRVSPRLGLSWDLKGDGGWIVNATYGRYVTALANNIADAGAAAGQPTWVGFLYGGPSLSAAEMGGNHAVITALFDWFFNDYGGVSNPALRFWADIPGLSPKVGKGLKSPYGDEFGIGVTRRLGNRGVLRVDYVRREYGDFYASEIVPNRWTPEDPIAGVLDLAIYRNENDLLSRTYDALLTRFDYRLSDRVSIGGNWTWSKAYGNFNGETGGSGPVASGVLEYQEYKDPSWNSPKGALAIDQRHKIRAWLVWDIISTKHHNLSLSVLENFFSGTPYEAVGEVDTIPYVGDPADLGYAGNPSPPNYFFTPRGHYTTEDITQTDISLNYSFFFNLLGARFEAYIQPEVLNLFNQQGVVGVNSTVYTCQNRSYLECFNPWTETPVEGVHWEKGPDFGKPTSEGDYQMPRTFRVSLGIRF